MAEKDYISIAKKRVTRPRDSDSYRKLLIYARNKKGKTTFSLSGGVENTLLLDPENGTDTMKAKNPYRWPINQWQDMQDAYGALRTGRLCPADVGGTSHEPFTIVSVDGLTRMNNMALRFAMRIREEKDLDTQPGMVQLKDYGKSSELMKQMLHNFHTLKMHVIFTAQERVITSGSSDDADDDADQSGIYYVPDMQAAARGTANSLVEVIGRLYTVKVPIKGVEKTERRLWIGIHEKYDTGFRSDFQLPDMIRKPTITKLINLMLTGDTANG